MSKEVVIIHYNTPELTEAAIRSVWKHCGEDWHINIFDNSDSRPFWRPMHNVTIIDNTQGQYINFDKFLSSFPERGEHERSHWGSAKHCKSVDYCFDIIQEGFVLMDSDAVAISDFTPLCCDTVAWSGWVHCNTSFTGYEIYRLCPFLCWLNVPMLQRSGVRYFNAQKMWSLTSRKPDCYYDTGAWLLEESRRLLLPYRDTEILGKYIEHFHGGSWRKNEYSSQLWLADMSNHFI